MSEEHTQRPNQLSKSLRSMENPPEIQLDKKGRVTVHIEDSLSLSEEMEALDKVTEIIDETSTISEAQERVNEVFQ